jgi:hypothetical protein
MVNEMTAMDLYEKHIKKIKRSGNNNYVGLCPFHDDTHQSLGFNEIGLYNCFTCGAKGNAISMAKHFNEDPRPFYDKPLINNGGTMVKNKTVTPKADLTDKAKEYWSNLGIKAEDDTYATMLLLGKDEKGVRTFPYFDEQDRVVGIKHHKSYWEGDGTLKWYGANQIHLFDEDEPIYICEGEPDTNRLNRTGANVLCSSGGAMSIPKPLPEFKKFGVIIVLDNDDAGRNGSLKCAQKIYDELGIICEIAKWRDGLPSGYDISDDMDWKEFELAIEQRYEFRPKPTNSKKGFRVIKMGDIDNENFIKPQVIVRNLVEESSLTLIAGGTGVGKSWMSINLACCIATGQPLFGHFETDKPRKVLLTQFELTDGQFKNRFDLMKGSFQSSSTLIDENFDYVVIGEALSFTNQWDNIEAVLSGGEYDNGVVIVDNLYTSTDISMSDNSEITILLSKMNYLMKKYNIALVVIAHNNKGVDKEGCISLDHIQGGAMLTRFASNIFQIQSSTLSGDYRVAKITKVRDEECNLLEIPFKLYWDASTYTFIKGEIIPKEKLHFLEASERWEIKLVWEIKSYEGMGNNPEQGGIWTRDDIWRFLEAENGWIRNASNEVKVTRFLKRVCDWGLLEKVSHNQYRIITAELNDE